MLKPAVATTITLIFCSIGPFINFKSFQVLKFHHLASRFDEMNKACARCLSSYLSTYMINLNLMLVAGKVCIRVGRAKPH